MEVETSNRSFSYTRSSTTKRNIVSGDCSFGPPPPSFTIAMISTGLRRMSFAQVRLTQVCKTLLIFPGRELAQCELHQKAKVHGDR